MIRPLLTTSAEGFFYPLRRSQSLITFGVGGTFYEVVNIRLSENYFLNGFYACVIE